MAMARLRAAALCTATGALSITAVATRQRGAGSALGPLLRGGAWRSLAAAPRATRFLGSSSSSSNCAAGAAARCRALFSALPFTAAAGAFLACGGSAAALVANAEPAPAPAGTPGTWRSKPAGDEACPLSVARRRCTPSA
jgi:hypothetical protein